MNSSVKRIKTIDLNLKSLEVIKNQGEYVGAGLSIELAVGPFDGAKSIINLELSHNIEAILNEIKTSLEMSRKTNLALAKIDLYELREFLEDW